MSNRDYQSVNPDVEALIDRIDMTAENKREFATALRSVSATAFEDARVVAMKMAGIALSELPAAPTSDDLDAALSFASDDTVQGCGLEQNTLMQAALICTWYAILALEVRDSITADQFDLLYRPWASVMDDDNRSKKPDTVFLHVVSVIEGK
jgi:hypothetical protein